ncbi:MAG: hypothetical protein LQ350_006975, partial [Teloschistes chrysophthalmus]
STSQNYRQSSLSRPPVLSPSALSSSSLKKRGSSDIIVVSPDDDDDDIIVPPKRRRPSQQTKIATLRTKVLSSHPVQVSAVKISLGGADSARKQFLENLKTLRGPVVSVVNQVDNTSPPLTFKFVNESILGSAVEAAPAEVMIGCLRCLVHLRQGEFIDTYRGKIIPIEEANKRGNNRTTDEGNYLMNFDKFTEPEAITKTEFLKDFSGHIKWHEKKVRENDWTIYTKNGEEMWLNPEHTPNKYVCDGMHVGGPTRFMNHSCDPNCRLFTASYNHSDPNLYDLAFFALEEIPAGTELTFDYKDEDDRSIITDAEAREVQARDGYMPQPCLCKAENCRRYFFN